MAARLSKDVFFEGTGGHGVLPLQSRVDLKFRSHNAARNFRPLGNTSHVQILATTAVSVEILTKSYKEYVVRVVL